MKIFKALATTIIFIAALTSIFYLLGFDEIIKLSPGGIHYIRQTDSLSFVFQFYWKNYSLLEPHVFNQTSTDGKAACEFPLIYFIVAKLYRLFGEKESIFRLFHLILFTLSMVSIQMVIQPISKIISFIIPLAILPSTILLYYSANFLPEISAFSFVILALSLMAYIHQKGYRTITGVAIMILITLSTLTKITYGIYGVAISLLILYLFWNKQISKKRFIEFFILISICTLIVIGWYSYAAFYNNTHGDEYFLLKARPIWEKPSADWNSLFNFITHYWNSAFYHPLLRYFFTLTFIWNLLYYGKYNRAVQLFVGSIVLGCLSIFFLFSLQLVDHDYYFICFVPAIAINLFYFFLSIRNFKYYYQSSLLVSAVAIVSGLVYAHNKLDQRYFRKIESQQMISMRLTHGDRMLDTLGVSRHDKILIIGDETRNGGLYALKRNGISVTNEQLINTENLLIQLSDKNNFIILMDTLLLDTIKLHPDDFRFFGEVNHHKVFKIENNYSRNSLE